MTTKKTRITYTSKWCKGKQVCVMHSQKCSEDRAGRFWFTGYNPFPCMYMMSTATVICKWLEENGWHREIGCRISKTIDTRDETGNIINHTVIINHYIPVNNS